MKETYFFALIILLSSCILAQNLEIAFRYFEDEEYEKAAAEFELALPEIEAYYGSDNIEVYALSLLYTAISFERSEEYGKTEHYYKKSMSVFQINNAKSNEFYLIVLNNLAIFYYTMGHYDKAIPLYQELLENTKSTLGIGHSEYGILLNDLADLYQYTGQYEKALKLYKKSIENLEKALGKDNQDYVIGINNLATLYRKMGQFDEALVLYPEALQITLKVLGKNNTLYSTILSNFAGSYKDIGKYNEALPLYLEVLENIEATIGKNHSYYGTILSNLAGLYQNMGQYNRALPLFLEALYNKEKTLGKNHSEYVTNLNNLAGLYETMGQYDKALPLYLEAIENAENSLGSEQPEYGFRLNNLAGLYEKMGQYGKALPLYLEALENTEIALGKEHYNYGKILNNLAGLYKTIGQYDKALPLYLEALENAECSLGKDHSYYGQIISNLAGLYNILGKYNNALPFYLEALENAENTMGKNHSEYGYRLNNLAVLYFTMGQYGKALPLYLEALDNSEKALGKDHPTYGSNLNNLAVLYKEMGKYENALPLSLESLKNAENTLGDNHSEYGSRLDNLATLYSAMGQYDKALPLFLEALDNTEKTLGKEHPYYGNSLNNLANLYKDIGQYDKALPLFLEALDNTEKALGKDHPDYGIPLTNLALLNTEMGQYSEALPLFTQAQQNTLYNLERNFLFLTEIEKENYSKIVLANFDIYHSIYLDSSQEQFSVTRDSYNLALTTSGMILSSSTQMRESILESGNEELIDQFNHWLTLKHQINHLIDQPISQRHLSVDSLSDVANSLERNLVRNSQEFASAYSSFQIKWENVRDNLTSNEAAVELISFDYHNGKQWTDSVYYCALILTREMDYPQMVFLFEERSLLNLLPGQYSGQSDYNLAYQGTRGSGTVFFDQPEYRGNQLYDLIWQPIDSILSDDIETVYFAPSGQLHSVSFAAIPTPGGKLLMEKYKLVQVTSTRTVAIPDQSKPISDAIVFGGVDYNLAEDHRETLAQQQKADSSLLTSYQPYRSVQTRHSGFSYLAGSLDEANTLSAMLSENYQTTTITGLDATEESFKTMSGMESPSIIHIATHGFYLPDTISDKQRDDFVFAQMGEDRFRLSDDPLMRSALVLAGANHTWAGNPISNDMDDGILTAREVSSMNLSNTQLAVLSACQTGLGDVMGSEGVSGLQRAFMMAGVKYIIMSLWTVPDKETAEFMETLYRLWLSGIEIRTAFHTTQQQMHANYPNEPFKWAGFVLVE